MDAAPDDTRCLPEPGLRARSKARRRLAIQHAAMRLFAERGYEGTTVADVAEAADVAPRTVSGYFASKVELATSFGDEIAARLTATFQAHPGQDIAAVVDAWLTGEARLTEPETVRLADAMYAANPTLRALTSAHITEAAERGNAAIAEATGLPAGHPMVAVCSASLGAALGAYLGELGRLRPSRARHAEMMRFVRGVIDAARTSTGQAPPATAPPPRG